MTSNFVLAYIVTLLIITLGDDVHSLNFEAHLRQALFSNWSETDIQSTPVIYPSDPVEVTFGLEVYHVKYLDEFKQVLTLNAIMHLDWKNPHLKWNRNNYGFLESITLPSDYIWRPDIYLYNSVNGGEVLQHGPAEVVIWYNGTVSWKPQVTLHARCSLDNYRFPFDENTCDMIFLSWTKTSLQMDINLSPFMEKKGFIAESYKSFNEWKIVDSHSKKKIANFTDPYLNIILSLHLKRQASMYSYTLFMPLIVTMMMMVTIFWLPPMAGEKFILGGIALVIITIILIHIYWIVPRNYSLPIIVAVASTTYFFMALSLIVSVATTVLSFRTDAAPAFLERHLKGRLGSILHVPSVPIQATENTDDEMKNFDWSLVAVAINRICFAIYIIIVFVLFILMIA